MNQPRQPRPRSRSLTCTTRCCGSDPTVTLSTGGRLRPAIPAVRDRSGGNRRAYRLDLGGGDRTPVLAYNRPRDPLPGAHHQGADLCEGRDCRWSLTSPGALCAHRAECRGTGPRPRHVADRRGGDGRGFSELPRFRPAGLTLVGHDHVRCLHVSENETGVVVADPACESGFRPDGRSCAANRPRLLCIRSTPTRPSRPQQQGNPDQARIGRTARAEVLQVSRRVRAVCAFALCLVREVSGWRGSQVTAHTCQQPTTGPCPLAPIVVHDAGSG